MKFKLIPAYLDNSSTTIRLHSSDVAKLLLKCDMDFLEELKYDLIEQGLYYTDDQKSDRKQWLKDMYEAME